MPSYENRDPAQAKELLEKEPDGVYLDVRTVEEFEQSHVPGAFNVPYAVRDASGGMAPNPDFKAVCLSVFQRRDQPLIVGCAVGGRSARACELLAASGYTNLVNVVGGFSGQHDPSGAVIVAGWQQRGFETSTQPAPERTYESLRARSTT